jgi:hypothetical protein
MVEELYDETGDMRGVFPEDDPITPEVDSVEERIEGVAQRAAEQALLWREEELEDVQAKATDYYMGRPFGNEVEGRSRVVSTDVRDTVQAILPSLMRIFFGPERSVQYQPRGPEDEALAEQLTDIAEVVVRHDNNGFLQIHGAMKDAMVRKLGIIKGWWEEQEKTEGFTYTGLSEQDLIGLESEEGIQIEVTAQYPDPTPPPPPQPGMPPQPPPPPGMLYDAKVTRTFKDGKVKFAAVPPEEFIFSPEARDRESCEMMGHVRAVPASELIAMGLDPDLVEEHKGKVWFGRTASAGDLETERRFDQDSREAYQDEADDARDTCWFGELYLYADTSEDEDGTADLIKVRVIGDNHELVDWEYCSKRPFALFVCDPEPHTLIGPSIADYVMDVQLVKSAIIRAQLDSLTLTLNPRTEVVASEVNMGDLMNHEIGGIVRVEKPGMMREVGHSFVGKEAFPMLQYMDEQKENRTGISKAAAGLDADALQSATKAAVAATLSGAQQHIEMLARVFAETGMAQLYNMILHLMVQHQDRPRTLKLRNEWVEVDPRTWHTNLDIRVNVALGAGGTEERLMLLDAITQHQKMLIDEGSPLVDLVQYREGLARQVELAGFPNADAFYRPWGPQEQQQFDQQQAQQPEQDPQMMLVQAQIEIEQKKLELEAQEVALKHQREVAKMEMDFALKQATAEAQYGAQINNAEIQADMQAAKAVIDAGAKEAQAKLQMQQKQAQMAAQGQGGPTPNGQTGQGG